jgi:hypothetical protein
MAVEDIRAISLDGYINHLEMQKKSRRDLYGFLRTTGQLMEETALLTPQRRKMIEQRDLDWVNFLKSVGGLDGLKPSGAMEPSQVLRTMCRRGIPAAYRGRVWMYTSRVSEFLCLLSFRFACLSCLNVCASPKPFLNLPHHLD